MNFNDYQELTESTNIYSKAINDYVVSLEIPNISKAIELRKLLELCYVGLGLTSEAGEIAGKLKKIIRDSAGNLTGQHKNELVKENGDVTWYNAQLFERLGVFYQTGAKQNIDKLTDRKDRNVIGGSGDNR